MAPIETLPPEHLDVPRPLARLVDISFNLWWTWNREPRRLFESIDGHLWSRYRNPVRLLLHVHRRRLEVLSTDRVFLDELARIAANFDASTANPAASHEIAYVSAEYALSESLPIYSGGLGVLSGDHLKEASDMNLPLVAVGLFYRRGYFRQIVDADGAQQHFYPDIDAYRLPLLRVKGADGRALRVPVRLAGRDVLVRVWLAQVGRIPLLLLDSFTSRNPPEDCYITSQLYVRGRVMRLAQEVLLGRGAVAVLEAMNLRPRLYHMNEGHSAFLALENLVRSGTADARAVRDRHVFTTHTPVPAGNEVFEDQAVLPYLKDSAQTLGVPPEQLLALGKPENGHAPGFNLTAMALKLSGKANGVSQLHGRVSRDMWGGFPIGAITNGVHLGTWLGREMFKVLGGHDAPDVLAARAGALPSEALWAAHQAQKHRLVRFVRVRSLRQAARHGNGPDVLRRYDSFMSPTVLTIGFARRFAAYKRADLVFADVERLTKLLCREDRPVQLIMAGKAHPADEPGQEIIRRIWSLASSEPLRDRVAFLEDYDMAAARLMVRGVDVWLNTPEWPHEASGTSGMKAAANGALHASVPDGWWSEGYAPDRGFSIGGEVPPDRERDARLLYELLEQTIVPLYYERGEGGLPQRWIAMMRASMAAFLGRFSTRRMLTEYAEQMYQVTSRGPGSR